MFVYKICSVLCYKKCFIVIEYNCNLKCCDKFSENFGIKENRLNEYIDVYYDKKDKEIHIKIKENPYYSKIKILTYQIETDGDDFSRIFKEEKIIKEVLKQEMMQHIKENYFNDKDKLLFKSIAYSINFY